MKNFIIAKRRCCNQLSRRADLYLKMSENLLYTKKIRGERKKCKNALLFSQ